MSGAPYDVEVAGRKRLRLRWRVLLGVWVLLWVVSERAAWWFLQGFPRLVIRIVDRRSARAQPDSLLGSRPGKTRREGAHNVSADPPASRHAGPGRGQDLLAPSLR